MKSPPKRFLAQARGFYFFTDAVDVVCPACQRSALVVRSDDLGRFTCLHCAASKQFKMAFWGEGFDNTDPVCWQGYALLRQTQCRGRVFWALNQAHLAYLKEYISADLRERVMERMQMYGRLERLGRVRNGYYVTSRLPHWMVLKSSRPHVLKAIARIQAMA